MDPRIVLAFVLAGCVAAGPARAETGDEAGPWLEQNLEPLVALYRHLHEHPELSYHEVETAKRIAAEWRQAGYTVTEGVGGTGVVGVLSNGQGPTLLLRTDLDALPVTEQTGLPYASHVQVRDDSGNDVGVMHACGHDAHMSVLVGTARWLAAHKERWRGTVVLVGQPAEEKIGGARAMTSAVTQLLPPN